MNHTRESPRRISRQTGRSIALVLFATSILLTIFSAWASSSIFLVVPLLGIASIAVSLASRSWWTITLGVIQLIMPALAIYVTYAYLATQQ